MGLATCRGPGCVVVGSGPSLNAVDVTKLADFPTIAFNRSYVAWRKWGFEPSFYACLDPLVMEDNLHEIRDLVHHCRDTRFFLSQDALRFGIPPCASVTMIRIERGERFSSALPLLTDFGNVGATSIQLLALLGYRRLVLTGIDGRYLPLPRGGVPGNAEFVTAADDPNHFCPEYSHGRRLFARPDLGRVLGQWPEVAMECARHGVEVLNASPGSALTCFPHIGFDFALDWMRDRPFPGAVDREATG